jgi:hypothetical protein
VKTAFATNINMGSGHFLSGFDVGVFQTVLLSVLLYLVKGGGVAGARSEE